MKIFKGGNANPSGYNILLIAGMLLATLSLLITFCYPAIEVTEDHTADAINQQKSDMVSAINNNTLVIQKLLDRIDEK